MNEKEIKAAAMSFDEFRDEPHAIAMALLDARAEREKADKALTHALRSVVSARDDFDALLDEVESERIRAFDLSDDLREATAERDALRKDAARLDWLEMRQSYSVSNLGGMSCAHLYVSSGNDVRLTMSLTRPTLRAAIDAALAVQP